MDRKLVSYADDNQIEKLQNALKKLDKEEISSLLDNRAVKGQGDPVSLLRALLLGISELDEAGQRLHVYLQCMDILYANDMNHKTAADMVALLMMEISALINVHCEETTRRQRLLARCQPVELTRRVNTCRPMPADSLSSNALAEIANKFVEVIKVGAARCEKALDLLPKILSAIAEKTTIQYQDNNMKGTQFKSHILNSICAGKWGASSVLQLTTMFRDVPVTLDELKFIILKILRLFPDLDMQELPALVYQLLLLAIKGHKRVVLEGITNFFVELDKTYKARKSDASTDEFLDSDLSDDTLRHTEGTVILHITFSIKQDQGLGREFIKYLKSGQQSSAARILAPFTLALALSVARIHRFEDQVFDFLKVTILRSFKDCERQIASHWVREVVPVSCDIQDNVLDTVQNSVFGWDHVTQGLVQLGFALMDSFGPKGAFGRIEPHTGVQVGPNHNACQLGAKVLLNTFKMHDMVRTEVLEQIFNRVITMATAPVSHYLDLLSQTVHSTPQILLDSIPKVREVFDYLSYLPPSSADSLLQAIQPLLKLSMSLKDSLILVLRKSMFSRKLDSRKIGVNGFLLILKHFKVLGGLPSSQPSLSLPSCSQTQVLVDIHTRYNAGSNEALCLEVLGNLRRCFSQQADVRLMVYSGVYAVMCKNSQLTGAILEMLLAQIKRYFESSDDVTPPLTLESCITAQDDQVFLAEPLAHLLNCIQLCLVKASNSQKGESEEDEDDENLAKVQSELEDILESLNDRIVKCDMEDFELDKSADFSMNNSVGVKNNIYGILVLGVYEVLLEYTYTIGKYNDNSSKLMLDLFENYNKLSALLKDKAGGNAGKKGRSANVKAPQSMLNLKFVSCIVHDLFSDVTPSHQESLSILRNNNDFVHYVVTIANQKLQQIQDKGSCSGADGSDKPKILKYCCTLGRVMLKNYIENQNVTVERKDRAKNVAALCLEGLTISVNIVCSRYPDQLGACLANLEQSLASAAPDHEKVHSHIKRFQRLTMNILNGPEGDRNLREVGLLIQLIGQLCGHLGSDSAQYEQVHSWLKRLCVEQNIDDTATCKLFLGLYIKLSRQVKSCLPLLRDLSQDIHSCLGDIDQEVEIEDKTHFSLITRKTSAPCVFLLVTQQLERELEDVEWTIGRLKGDVGLQRDDTDDSLGVTQVESIEKGICTRLGTVVTAVHELVQSPASMGLCSDVLLKGIGLLYGTLTLFVKYYLTLYGQHVGQFNARFEKLVKLSGTHLTPYVYAFITFIQAAESDHVQQNAEKAKKDKKKAAAAISSGRAKALKDAKNIPNIIFAIEQYERYLIQLSKKSKINLMEHMKLSTSRDFRINTAMLQVALEKQQESDSEESEEEDGDQNGDQKNQLEENSGSESDGNEENTAPPSKRPKHEETQKTTKKGNKLGKLSKKKQKT